MSASQFDIASYVESNNLNYNEDSGLIYGSYDHDQQRLVKENCQLGSNLYNQSVNLFDGLSNASQNGEFDLQAFQEFDTTTLPVSANSIGGKEFLQQLQGLYCCHYVIFGLTLQPFDSMAKKIASYLQLDEAKVTSFTGDNVQPSLLSNQTSINIRQALVEQLVPTTLQLSKEQIAKRNRVAPIFFNNNVLANAADAEVMAYDNIVTPEGEKKKIAFGGVLLIPRDVDFLEHSVLLAAPLLKRSLASGEEYLAFDPSKRGLYSFQGSKYETLKGEQRISYDLVNISFTSAQGRQVLYHASKASEMIRNRLFCPTRIKFNQFSLNEEERKIVVTGDQLFTNLRKSASEFALPSVNPTDEIEYEALCDARLYPLFFLDKIFQLTLKVVPRKSNSGLNSFKQGGNIQTQKTAEQRREEAMQRKRDAKFLEKRGMSAAAAVFEQTVSEHDEGDAIDDLADGLQDAIEDDARSESVCELEASSAMVSPRKPATPAAPPKKPTIEEVKAFAKKSKPSALVPPTPAPQKLLSHLSDGEEEEQINTTTIITKKTPVAAKTGAPNKRAKRV